MPYPNEHSVRVRSPQSFEKGSFRSKQIKKGLRIILGKLKTSGKMITQAYRFNKDIYSLQDVKDFVKKNKIKYLKIEPAIKK